MNDRDPANDSMLTSWLRDRFVQPWGRLSGIQKLYIVLASLGLSLGWFGDLVYLYEHGVGFFVQALSPAKLEPSDASILVPTTMLMVNLPIAESTFRSRLTAWSSVLVFASLGLGLGYLALTTGHPVAIAPAIALISGTVVWIPAYRSWNPDSTLEEDPSED